jgi:Ni,Fe-hydrogenase III small subunit
VIWQPDPQKNQTVYTAVDRSVYIEVTVPAGADQPLTLLAPAVQALPQLCTAADAAGNTTNPKLPLC